MARVLPAHQISFVVAPDQVVSIRCCYERRARQIKLSADERGIRLTLPLASRIEEGIHFLHQQSHWIAAQHAYFCQFRLNPRIIRGEAFVLPLLGKQYSVDWRSGRHTSIHRCTDETIIFQAPLTASATSIQRAIYDFYQAQARGILARWLRHYLPNLPTAPTRIALKIQSSQWGSLSCRDHLTLNLALVLGRPAAFEYVLVHELCHLIHRNHSANFWLEVASRFPAWREEHAWCHHHGDQLRMQLAELLPAFVPGAHQSAHLSAASS